MLPLTTPKKKRLGTLNEQMAGRALRVLGVAYRDIIPARNLESLEQGLSPSAV